MVVRSADRLNGTPVSGKNGHRKVLPLNKALENARKSGGLSMRAAARLMGVPLASYQNWESNKRVPLALFLPRLVCFLQTSRKEVTLMRAEMRRRREVRHG